MTPPEPPRAVVDRLQTTRFGVEARDVKTTRAVALTITRSVVDTIHRGEQYGTMFERELGTLGFTNGRGDQLRHRVRQILPKIDRHYIRYNINHLYIFE